MQEEHWVCVKAGTVASYTGPAVNPINLSLYERYVLQWGRHYVPQDASMIELLYRAIPMDAHGSRSVGKQGAERGGGGTLSSDGAGGQGCSRGASDAGHGSLLPGRGPAGDLSDASRHAERDPPGHSGFRHGEAQ